MSTDKLVTKSDLQDFYSRILPYLGGTAEAGFTPIGTVISVMGKTAPANYLACNGQVVNIADYPELANYFEEQFGSKNYFGGDGTTTFGIVDLSGEFLRGTGTNSHSGQGDGAEVGEHQDAGLPDIQGTIRANIHGSNSAPLLADQGGAFSVMSAYSAAAPSLTATSSVADGFTFKASKYNSIYGGSSEVTPTNTSVLFCIATKNIYLNPSLDFSTSEKVVGTWIDGKTLYQKTIDCGALPNATTKDISLDSLAIERVYNFTGVAYNANDVCIPLPYVEVIVDNNDSSILVNYQKSLNSVRIKTFIDYSGFSHSYITIQYTKTSD